MSDAPKPPDGYETWLDFFIKSMSCSPPEHMDYARAELQSIRARLADSEARGERLRKIAQLCREQWEDEFVIPPEIYDACDALLPGDLDAKG